MEIKENIIKISGRATLEEPLVIGHDYNLMMSVNCDKEEKVDLQENDEFNMVYKCRPTGVVDILDDLGKKLTATPKKSLSQQMRIVLERYDNYEICMMKLLRHPTELYDFIRKLD